MNKILRKTRSNAQGFSLIEVLISTLVLTVGILGVAAMQMVSLQTNQGAYMRSQGTLLAMDMLDRMRANREGYRSSTEYDSVDTSNTGTIPAYPGCQTSATGCSPAQMAQADVRGWAQNFTNVDNVAGYRPVLMGGVGTVTRGAGNEFTVTVSWEDRDYDTEGNLTRELVTRTVSYTAELY